MWDDFSSRFASSKRVVEKYRLAPFSIYPATSAMGHDRKAVYWGVEPYEGTAPYSKWAQPQARDFGDSDFNQILKSAREWLKTPVLSKNVEGIVRDTQLRAALDLAVRSEGYESALHPTVYNNLLAKLAGVSTEETLMTVQKEATDQNRVEAAAAVEGTVRNNMTMPKFASSDADKILARLDRMAAMVQEKHEQWGMPFAAAKEIVNEFDKMADEVEIAAFGEDSLLSRQAEIITASIKTAEVIQRDPDEKYMDTFKNPQAPIQTEADEPYMSAYKTDDSSAVHHGKSETGRALAP